MREGIGSVMLYNIIIIFIVIVFAVLAGTMSYAKAFKVNSAVSKALQMFEGYNQLAYSNYPEAGAMGEVVRVLQTLGYRYDENYTCSKDWLGGGTLANVNLGREIPYKVCIYNYPVDSIGYYDIGIVTYLQVEIPVIGGFLEVPIYSRTPKMYIWK